MEPEASGNLVEGNLIGTEPRGLGGRWPTASTAILLDQGSNDTIGGTAPRARNVISGNGHGATSTCTVPATRPSRGTTSAPT